MTLGETLPLLVFPFLILTVRELESLLRSCYPKVLGFSEAGIYDKEAMSLKSYVL